MRSLYGIVVCGIIGIVVTLLTTPEPAEKLEGLVIGSVSRAKERFKGGTPNEEPGERLLLTVVAAEMPEGRSDAAILHPDDLARLKAQPGDILYASDRRWWLGGLRSVHLRAGDPGGEPGTVALAPSRLEAGELGPQEQVLVEKIM
jgi:hypothetical protein